MFVNVKVGGINYDVTVTDLSAYDHEGFSRMGNMHETKALIEVSENMPEERQHQTLIHEIMHAVFFEAGIDIENEEDIVNRVGLIMYQVLKDNDFSFLNDSKNEKEM